MGLGDLERIADLATRAISGPASLRYTEEAVQKRLGLTSKRMLRVYRRILDDGPDLACAAHSSEAP